MNLNYIYYRVEQLEMIVHRMAHTHTQTVARLHNCCRTWITMAGRNFGLGHDVPTDSQWCIMLSMFATNFSPLFHSDHNNRVNGNLLLFYSIETYTAHRHKNGSAVWIPHVSSVINFNTFFFSLACLISGYGNIAPRTTLGRVVTLAYALLGIPLTLVYLSSTGGVLARVARGVFSR